jgi:hypothetical protein
MFPNDPELSLDILLKGPKGLWLPTNPATQQTQPLFLAQSESSDISFDAIAFVTNSPLTCVCSRTLESQFFILGTET